MSAANLSSGPEPAPDHGDLMPESDEDIGFTRLDRAIVWLGKKLSLVFAVIVLVSFYEIVRRYVFDSPTLWVHESVTFAGASLFVLGGLYALATDRHVRIVLLYDAVSPRVQRWLRVVHHLLGLAFCGMMLYASWFMAKGAVRAPWGGWRLETSGSAWNPPFPAFLKVIILLAIVIMTAQFVLHLIRDLRRPASAGEKDNV
ncbi:TRAP transporter small permease subunit [Marinobacter subterrani]|uniref:TRAP transporter small permease protein n=1 Tax=Marinobacter subterrani TaxID=1658765 RepID=A0A0J7JEQ9_9GAMM|nr:TRAP transporter small permease subunit [Marinobacter subterrani]KMQ76612.1 TRAP-type mannitol/chloroaromatic compound transport system, small permease component [Marinobacter subterrani]